MDHTITLLLLVFAITSTTASHFHSLHSEFNAKHIYPKEYVFCEKDGEMVSLKHHRLLPANCDAEIARAKITNQINQTGWGLLEVEIAHHDVPMWLQGYAAGYVEGRATRELIRMHISNTVDGYCDGAEAYCRKLADFLTKNVLWQKEQVEKYPDDQYWQQVNITYNQLIGLIDGYEGTVNQQISVRDLVVHPIYMIQLAGDLEDLAMLFKRPEHLRSAWKGGHCSALVRLLDDYSDIFFSHVTWSSYSTMLRMQKKITFKLNKHSTPGHTYSFSSYPGAIPSTDDFMLSSSGLAIMETTISNYNTEIMDEYIKPETVLCWVRAQYRTLPSLPTLLVATRVSSTTNGWAEVFAKYNSGTYNNQWIILDYKKFTPGMKKRPQKEFLHILEQLPGYIMHKDLTQHLLNDMHWPSYNMPFFPEVYNDSMTATFAAQYGDWFTYEKNPRARIFERDYVNVKDMSTMRKLMRSNNYKTDPFAKCECDPPYSAENAISCRSDLNPADGKYPFSALGHRDHGATDMKLTNYRLHKNFQFEAIAGPTHDPVPVFDWKTTPFRDTVPHVGQPDRWTFKPIVHKWTNGGLFGMDY